MFSNRSGPVRYYRYAVQCCILCTYTFSPLIQHWSQKLENDQIKTCTTNVKTKSLHNKYKIEISNIEIKKEIIRIKLIIVRINFHFSRAHNMSDSVKFNVASKYNMSNSSFEKKIKWKNHIHKCHDQVYAR